MPHLPTTVDDSRLNISRRSFLQAAAGGALGWSCAAQLGLASSVMQPWEVRPRARQLIMIFLAGGPSQIDTWDPKPEAPVEFRNIDPACSTSIPGVLVSENLPGIAQRMHQVALVRSLSHEGPATHSAGQQLLMTGKCFFHNQVSPHIGSVLSQLLGSTGNLPANMILGGSLGHDFIVDGNGQTAAWLGRQHAPHVVGMSNQHEVVTVQRETWETQQRYGFHSLGQQCLQARQLVERGTRMVTINQFGSVLDQKTWDMHANGGRLNSTAKDYRETLCPQLDQALCALLDDLSDRGLLAETVVAVCGEMGRSARVNSYGGRDHHLGAWSALLAGGPIQPGAIVGATDAYGETPATRPVTPAEFCATLYHAVGVDANRDLLRGPTGAPQKAFDAEPIHELF